MDNRINVVLTPETKDQILQTVSALKILMPFLIKLSDTDRKALQMLDDGRKPFTQKAYDYASRNNAINPGTEMVLAGMHDLDLYASLSTVEKDLLQLVEMVRDTKQLAGAETYEIARFIYMKAKMALKMKEPGMQTVVDELGKLYKQAPAATSEPAKP
jgi:hypothetical protein